MRQTPDIFLARRYLRPRRSLTSVITLLSILGPAIGVTVLIVTTAVFSGFQREIKQRLLGMQAHLQVYASPRLNHQPAYITDPQRVMQIMDEAGIAAAPTIEDLVLLQHQGSMEIKSMFGIAPEKESRITDLTRSIIKGKYNIEHGEILIGTPLANQLNLRLGDQLLVHAPRRMTEHIRWDENGALIAEEIETVYLPEEVKVAGIFSFGVYQMDSNIVYMHIDQAAELVGMDWNTATTVKGTVEDPFNLQRELDIMRKRLPEYVVVTWQEQNERLLGAIQVEKNLTLFLLFFIVLVAAFSIAGTLIASVIQKTREIGIIKALGLSPLTIARIFLYQGMIIGAVGTAGGCLAGTLIVHHRETVAELIARLIGREIFPPELYYLERIPAWLTASEVAIIGGLAFIFCVMAALLPAIYASAMKPARALAEE